MVNPETRHSVSVEAWYAEAPLFRMLNYMLACSDWVNHFYRLGLRKTGTIHLFRAHIPWARVHGFLAGVWVYGAMHSGYLEGSHKDDNIIFFHDKVTNKVAEIALMMHELMHFFQGRGEQADHARAIQVMDLITKKYNLINNPRNKENFANYGVNLNEIPLKELLAAHNYLKHMH